MSIYEIAIYDEEGNCLSKDYKHFTDRQQTELAAEADCDWLGGDHWEIQKIR